jgi:hypothetical protein
MDTVCGEDRIGGPAKRRKLMKKEKHEKATVTVRLTDEEDQVLRRLSARLKTLARLDTLLASLKTRPRENSSITPLENTWKERRP